MNDIGSVKRRPDGSLDTDHYRDIAHQLRSATARRWLQGLVSALVRGRPLTGPAATDGEP